MKNKDGAAVDDFLNQVNEGKENNEFMQPDAKPFANIEVQQDEPVITNQNDDGKKEGEDEKPIAFHLLKDDPKFQRFLAKEIAKVAKDLKPEQAIQVKEEIKKSPDMIAALATLVGNDTPEKVAFLNNFKNEWDAVRAEARSATETLQQERQATQRAEKELTDGFESIEDSFNVDLTSNDPLARKTRGEFIDFIQRVAPKNADGEILAYPDFQETFTLFQETKKRGPVVNRSKSIASRSMERSSDASKVPLPADTSWKGVEKFFSSLKG